MITSRLLLVEGPDDKHFIKNLAFDLNVAAPEIKDKEGWPNLRETLYNELRASDLERLGVVIDADDELMPRWHSIGHTLTSLGYSNMPDEPQTGGALITA